MAIIHFTDKDMTREALSKRGTVLVDFWASWCGPCKMLAPIVEKIADEYDGKLTVAKLNIDDYSGPAVDLGINSIPTLIIFKDGEPADMSIGYIPYEAMKEFVDKNL